ncbi:MAG TPA: ATP-binding cassette domain-containing protein, partial [Acidimicrobiia bacterium]|nr:ATP-binding cassette domain-containing protein [Acidimicrobiia bacterium]
MTNDVRLSPEDAVRAEALSKSYGETTALEELDLSIPSGTIFGLLGPNGAGKSTTVKILTTLSRPDSGSAEVGGVDVLVSPEQVRHMIGYVAQKHGTDDQASGTENLALQARIHGLDR